MKNKLRIIAILLMVQMLFVSVAAGVFADEMLGDAGDPAVAEEVVTEDASAGEAVESAEALNADVAAPTVTLTGTTAKVTWGESLAVTDVSEYVSANGAWTLVTSVKPADGQLSADFTGLAGGKTYGFTVKTADGESDKAQVTLPLAAPNNFQAFPSYQSVLLAWEPSAGAEKYNVYRDGVLLTSVTGVAHTGADGVAYLTWTDTNNSKDTTYKYQMTAVSGTTESARTAEMSAARVRIAYYKCKFRASAKLESHDKAKKKHTFKKGQTITAEGYSQGKYQFYYKGNIYHAMWFRMKNTSCKAGVGYSKNAYDKQYHGDYIVAENYVNTSNSGKSYGSKTKYLIWISLYSQRLFVFTGSKGNWKVLYSWQCNTGRASTPTPTGFSKDIWNTATRHSSHRWWSCFSSWNSIHGRNKGDAKLGKPISNGCVRIENANAKLLMKLNKKKLHTKVISW
jgi:hypothetical protein